jgi:hypothetical protein
MMKDLPLRPDDPLELFEIDLTATATLETLRPEPVFAAAAPLAAEFRETGRLDPARATAEPNRPPPMSRRTALSFGLIGSLGVHLLPLLVLLHWNSAPAEIAPPIAVQLVVEEPPPPPPAPPPQAAKPPPPGALASDDFGDPKARSADHAAEPPGEALPAEMQVAMALPPPKPMPPPELVSALSKPAPPADPAAQPEEPTPTPLLDAPVKMAAAGRLAPPTPHPAPRGQNPGPAATRDAYLAYCMSLIRGHFGLLAPNFLAGRRGATILIIQVLGDGTIARIAVAQRSPYPDIDTRIEQAVVAVGRFPPVPQWFQGPKISLTLHISYPDGL